MDIRRRMPLFYTRLRTTTRDAPHIALVLYSLFADIPEIAWELFDGRRRGASRPSKAHRS
jgi:hypothetical protein